MISGYTPHFWETTIYVEIVPLNPMFKWLCRLGIYHGSPWYPLTTGIPSWGIPLDHPRGFSIPVMVEQGPCRRSATRPEKKNECESVQKIFHKEKEVLEFRSLCLYVFGRTSSQVFCFHFERGSTLRNSGHQSPPASHRVCCQTTSLKIGGRCLMLRWWENQQYVIWFIESNMRYRGW